MIRCFAQTWMVTLVKGSSLFSWQVPPVDLMSRNTVQVDGIGVNNNVPGLLSVLISGPAPVAGQNTEALIKGVIAGSLQECREDLRVKYKH